MAGTNRRTFLRGGVLGASAVALAACSRTNTGGGGEEGEDLLTTLQDAGKITVGFAGEAPYSFEDGGELTGATVALHREIFGELGIDEVEGVTTEFGSLIPGLTANRFDAISAGMSILPERCEQAAFSEPEFQYTTALLVPKGNPEGLETLDDVVDKGLKIATMTGAIEGDYAKALDLDSTEVGKPQDGVDAVSGGRVDAFALTGISLNYKAETSNLDLEVTTPFVAEIDGVKQVGAGATVFRKEDTSLLDAYNEKLAAIVADKDRYLDIVGEFGFTEEELPTEDMTTEILCSGDLSSLQ
jgi:polar amino acid transport system substrate-binding protein